MVVKSVEISTVVEIFTLIRRRIWCRYFNVFLFVVEKKLKKRWKFDIEICPLGKVIIGNSQNQKEHLSTLLVSSCPLWNFAFIVIIKVTIIIAITVIFLFTFIYFIYNLICIIFLGIFWTKQYWTNVEFIFTFSPTSDIRFGILTWVKLYFTRDFTRTPINLVVVLYWIGNVQYCIWHKATNLNIPRAFGV